MPTYVYECAKCGEELEAWQSFSDKPLKKHAGSCGGKLTKVLQPVGIVFKGSGFHRTDSRSGSKRSRSDDGADTKDSSSEKSGESDKTDKTDKTTTKPKADSQAASSSSNGAQKSPDSNPSGSKPSSSRKESSTPAATPK